MGRSVAALALAVVVASSCAGGPSGPSNHSVAGPTMGTTYTVKVVADEMDREALAALKSLVETELNLVNDLMSHYKADSELSRFNDWAEPSPFPISAEILEVFLLADEIHDLSDGALDVSVGPLVDAWGFGPPGQPAEPPPDDVIADLLASSGHEHLKIDPQASTLRKARPGLRCDLSSTAKGYAVDRVANALADAGYTRYLVEVGGELRASGTTEQDGPWRVAVERPDPMGRSIHRVLPLTEGGIATSGDYRNYYEVDGRRVSHLIDPRTGRPIEHRLASVTVVEPTCARADALATALSVLGQDAGYRLATELDLAALFLVRKEGGFTELSTPRFDALKAEEETAEAPAAPPSWNRDVMGLLLLTIAVFAAVVLVMAVGVLVSNRCLRGSCGGPDVIDPNGVSLKCAACPKRENPPAG